MLLAKATGVDQDPGSLSEAGQPCFDSQCFTELRDQVQLSPISLALAPPALQPSHVLLFPSASCDQNRVGQDSYVLMASSQVEMEEWVKFLRRVAGTPSGGKDGHSTTISEQVWEEEEAGSRHHLSLCSVQGRGSETSEATGMVRSSAEYGQRGFWVSRRPPSSPQRANCRPNRIIVSPLPCPAKECDIPK